MFRTTVLASLGTVCALAAIPSAASAQDGSSVGFRLQAVVQPFCRIQSEMGDSPRLFVDGVVELGAVREVCNTRGGYRVNVQLINVDSGTLHHGTETQDLDSEGRAQIRWGEARSRTTTWRLTQASLRQDNAPIYLRVSISPI